MTESAAGIEALLAEYAAAVLAKDPARLRALYAPEIRVFDAWGAWGCDGLEAWGGNLADWLGSLGEESVEVRFDGARIARHGDFGSVSAFVTYAAVDAAGTVVRSLDNRLSWVLARTAGRWAVVHEHTSAPIGAENKAMLQRR